MHGETRRGTREVIGVRIRAIREARGLSLRGLSDLADIPGLMIAQMERGRILVKFENLLCLARALGISVMKFFGDDEGDGDDI